jgi:hypothetical protein
MNNRWDVLRFEASNIDCWHSYDTELQLNVP